MSLKYLPEHAHPTLLALDLARKEAKHLCYSQTPLFALSIGLARVESLDQQPEVAEIERMFGFLEACACLPNGAGLAASDAAEARPMQKGEAT